VRPARRRDVEDVLLAVLSCAKADAGDEAGELAELERDGLVRRSVHPVVPPVP
jgi:hypothetical protein